MLRYPILTATTLASSLISEFNGSDAASRVCVDQFSRWPNDNVNQLKALARKLLGTPKHLRLLEGDTDVFGDGSVTLVSTPGHIPGSQSLLVHLNNSGFIILSGDVVHLEENFEKNTVPSLNTDKAGQSLPWIGSDG